MQKKNILPEQIAGSIKTLILDENQEFISRMLIEVNEFEEDSDYNKLSLNLIKLSNQLSPLIERPTSPFPR